MPSENQARSALSARLHTLREALAESSIEPELLSWGEGRVIGPLPFLWGILEGEVVLESGGQCLRRFRAGEAPGYQRTLAPEDARDAHLIARTPVIAIRFAPKSFTETVRRHLAAWLAELALFTLENGSAMRREPPESGEAAGEAAPQPLSFESGERQQRLAALGLRSASIAHDVVNLSRVVAYAAELLSEGLADLLSSEPDYCRLALEAGRNSRPSRREPRSEPGTRPADELPEWLRRRLAGMRTSTRDQLEEILGCEAPVEEWRQSIILAGLGEQLTRIARGVADLGEYASGLGRYASGQVGRNRVRVDLGGHLRDSVRLLEPSLPVPVDLAVDDGLWVEADPAELSRIWQNLILNAANAFSDSGRSGLIQISLAREPLGPGEAEAAFVRVADEGPGFNADPEGLFEPFTGSQQSGSHAGPGLGLGLAICRDLVGAHGGRIRAHNRVGGGACVEVCLPLAGPDASPGPGQSG